jgi:hypothetical protein
LYAVLINLDVMNLGDADGFHFRAASSPRCYVYADRRGGQGGTVGIVASQDKALLLRKHLVNLITDNWKTRCALTGAVLGDEGMHNRCRELPRLCSMAATTWR